MMNKKIPIFGLLLVVFGMLFLLNTFDLVYFTFGDFLRFILPVFLIGLGLWLIIRKKREEQRFQTESNYQHFGASQDFASPGEKAGPSATAGLDSAPPPPPPPPPGGETDSSGQRVSASPEMEPGRIKYSKVLGDIYVDCQGINLQNIVVSMGVGDIELKLHGGILGPGLNRMIVTGFVGDIRIFIPSDMPVFVHSSCLVGDIRLFGNSTSGFSNDLDGQTADYNTSENKLYIAINHFIGDIKVSTV